MEKLTINAGNPRTLEIELYGENMVKIPLSQCVNISLVLIVNGRFRNITSYTIVNDNMIAQLSANDLRETGVYRCNVLFELGGEYMTSESVHLFDVAQGLYKTVNGMAYPDTSTTKIDISTPATVAKGLIPKNEGVKGDVLVRDDVGTKFVDSLEVGARVINDWSKSETINTPSATMTKARFEANEVATRKAQEDATQAQAKADSVVGIATNALNQADAAVVTANKADRKSDDAVATANKADAKSTQANEKADNAVVVSSEAKTIAQGANTKSDTAIATATQAKNIAEGIDGKATEALAKSTDAVAKATSADTKSDTAIATANTAKTIAEGVDGKATEALATANTANDGVTQLWQKVGNNWTGVNCKNMSIDIPSDNFTIECYLYTPFDSNTHFQIFAIEDSAITDNRDKQYSLVLETYSLTGIRLLCNNYITTQGTDRILNNVCGSSTHNRYNHIVYSKGNNSATLSVNGVTAPATNPELFNIAGNAKLILLPTNKDTNTPMDNMSFFRVINSSSTQSDIDLLYNQGRCSDVVLGDEWRGEPYYKVNGLSVWKATNTVCTSEMLSNGLRVTISEVGGFAGVIIGNTNMSNLNTRIGDKYYIKYKVECDNYSVLGYNPSHPNAFTKNTKLKDVTIDANTHEIEFIAEVIKLNANGDLQNGFSTIGASKDGLNGHYVQVTDVEVRKIQILDEFTPNSLTPTKWINQGVNKTDIDLVNPVFTSEPPIKERMFGLSTATKPTPVAIGQKYYTTDTGDIFEVSAKSNTEQFEIHHYKKINN